GRRLVVEDRIGKTFAVSFGLIDERHFRSGRRAQINSELFIVGIINVELDVDVGNGNVRGDGQGGLYGLAESEEKIERIDVLGNISRIKAGLVGNFKSGGVRVVGGLAACSITILIEQIAGEILDIG